MSTRSYRIGISLAVALGVFCVWGVLTTPGASAIILPASETPVSLSRVRPVSTVLHTTSEPPIYVLGESCGAGELLPDWVLCLYGAIHLSDIPLANVPITIALGDRAVTGTTFIHPGYITPTYGIDISSLEPDFLHPVTLTARISGTEVTREIIVYPDFHTQSQRFDVVIPTVGALDPALVWGYVVDFGSGGPVTDALVTAEYEGHTSTVTTTQMLSQSLPLYTLTAADLAQLGWMPGNSITLTANYDGDVDRRIVTVNIDAVQVNFVTGWKCDDFNPLPETGGGRGMPDDPDVLPETGGGRGMPDIGCFWGYGIVDGETRAGVEVHLEISGTVYNAVTQEYPGETQPRYGIAVWGGQAISGTSITVTGVYSGFIASQNLTVALNAGLHQQVDLNLRTVTGLITNITNGNRVQTLLWHDGYLWAGTEGGVVRWSPQDGSYVKYTTADGLANNTVLAIAVGPDGVFWFGTRGGISRYSPNDTREWQTFTTTHGLANDVVNTIVVSPDNTLLVGTEGGASHYVPNNTPPWQPFTITGSMNRYVTDIAIGSDGAFWFGTDQGVIRYFPGGNPEWQTFTVDDGLTDNWVNAIALDLDGGGWFATKGGVSHYSLDSSEWQTFTTDNGLASNWVTAIAIESNGTFWFSTYGNGVSHYSPDTCEWQTFTTTSGLSQNLVTALTTGPNDTVWAGTEMGIGRYLVGSTPSWQTYTTADRLAHNSVTAIAVGPDDEVCFGTVDGISCYTPGDIPQWQTFFTNTEGVAENVVTAIARTADGAIWFSTQGKGVSRHLPGGNPDLQTFTMDDGLVSNDVHAIAVDPDGSLWFGTVNGVSHFIPSTSEWQTFTATSNGLVHNVVNVIVMGSDGTIWFGTSGGVSHYLPGFPIEWQTFTTTNGLVDNNVLAIAIDSAGIVWFGTSGGVSRYASDSSNEWQSFTTTHGLAANTALATAIGQGDVVWVGTDYGVSRYFSNRSPEWQTFTAADGLAGNRVPVIVAGSGDKLWFGTNGGISYWAGPIPQPDLSLTLSTVQMALAGQAITYTFAIRNQGENTAISPTLILTLPMALETPPQVWQLPTLLSNTTILTLTYSLTLPEDSPVHTWLTATATIHTPSFESFTNNNTARTTTYIRDADCADTRITCGGPPFLVPNQSFALTCWADNAGGLDAQQVTTTLFLPPGLIYQNASPTPAILEPVIWTLNTLPWNSLPQTFVLTATAAPTLPPGSSLAVVAHITTSTLPDPAPTNNTASLTLPVNIGDVQTLILIAPTRLAIYYGATPLLADLYTLARHPRVQGMVLDIEQDPEVQQAYIVWDAAPDNPQAANAVAEAIHTLIASYRMAYPQVHYLVLIGNDNIIPFYRIPDHSGVMWDERRYRHQVPGNTPLQAALRGNYFLTDDFYATAAPTYPASPFWTAGQPLYLPDLAVGRLVETPVEIRAALAAFFANDGQLTLDPALIGGDSRLTGDLVAAQCATLQVDGVATICTTNSRRYRQGWLGKLSGLALTDEHGHHFGFGQVDVFDLQERTEDFSQILHISIACHTGLNVPPGSGHQVAQDLPQTFTGRGGTYIAPAAYAYATPLGIGYSEAMAALFVERLTLTTTQELGPALVWAKQTYYASHAWFDRLDEKVLLPMTLYGLPMTQITSPDSTLHQQATSRLVIPQPLSQGETSVLTYTLYNLTYTAHITTDGTYYDYQGQVLAQDHLAAQPGFLISLTPTLSGSTVRGVALRGATYTTTSPFDPLIVEAWALGETRNDLFTEPPVTLQGWDRDWPYLLGTSQGLAGSTAMLNLALGMYHAESQTEQLFTALTLEVLYSASVDTVPPALHKVEAYTSQRETFVLVQASDNLTGTGIADINIVYDDGQEHWQNVSLVSLTSDTWKTILPSLMVNRYYVQAIDGANNVIHSQWQMPYSHPVYLPLVIRQVELLSQTTTKLHNL